MGSGWWARASSQEDLHVWLEHPLITIRCYKGEADVIWLVQNGPSNLQGQSSLQGGQEALPPETRAVVIKPSLEPTSA